MTPILVSGRPIKVGSQGLGLPDASLPDSLTLADFQGYSGPNDIPTMHVVQRAPGRTDRDVPLAFTWSGSPPSFVDGRVVNSATGAVVRDWTALTGMTLDVVAGSGIGTLPGVPQGSPYVAQIREGRTRPSSGPLFSASSHPWGVGVVFRLSGQSQIATTFQANSVGNVPGTSMAEDTYRRAGAVPAGIFDVYGWHGPSNQGVIPATNNTLFDNWRMFLRLMTWGLRDANGGSAVPFGVVPYYINGSSIDAFTPGSGVYTTLDRGNGVTSGSMGLASGPPVYAGDFEGVLWHQGGSDQSAGTAAYRTKLIALMNGYLADVSGFGRTGATLRFLPAVIDTEGSASSLIEGIREAELRFVRDDAPAQGWTGTSIGWMSADLPNDGLHITDPAVALRFVRRVVQAALWAAGAAPYGARGPMLGSPSRAGTVITFPVSMDGGTALQPAVAGRPLTGWAVNTAADFSGTNLPATVSISGSNVLLTLAAGTSFPVYVKHLGGRVGAAGSANPDITNLIYDNARYPRWAGKVGTAEEEALGFPLLPTVGGVAVA